MHIHVIFTAALFLAFMTSNSSAQENANCNDNQSRYYVSNTGSDESGDGSAENPYGTLQHAVELGCSGDSIIMFPGFYAENISVATHNLTIGGFGILTGNFDPESTIVDGLDVAVAFYASGDTLNLMDFTIQNGRAPFGAGLYLAGSNNTHVNHMIVRDNTGTGDITAHGIAISSSNVLVENTLVTGNYGRKHTVSVGGSGNQIRNCTIIDNPTWEYGGGVVSSSANLVIDNCYIANNNKGGVAIQYTTATITNTTIVNNSTFGVRLRTGNHETEVRMMNCILDNSTNLQVSQSGIGTAHFVARHSIIPGGSDYGWASVYSTFDFDETVLDGPAYLTEDGHLQAVSPAIGAGTTQVEWADGTVSNIWPTDLDGEMRPLPEGSMPDMGCYEHPLGSPMPVEGCTDDTACNFDPFAVVDDGSCNLPACLDPMACNFDPLANCDGGPSACILPSCTDEAACNFDSEALCGGGECYFGEAGCDDPYACNYIAEPGCVDLTLCDYSCCPGPGCCGAGTVWSGTECVISTNCPYDFDLDGSVNLTDLLDFLAHYETSCSVE